MRRARRFTIDSQRPLPAAISTLIIDLVEERDRNIARVPGYLALAHHYPESGHMAGSANS